MSKKFILTLILSVISYVSLAQIPDTIINKQFYKSYYDVDIKQPILVAYKLYKGGGTCRRDKFRFKNDTQIPTLTLEDYQGSGFDMGHLANAEDFAFDCQKDEQTFRFYNVNPQFGNLNRGVWRKWENQIRKDSQNDSLLVICGGHEFTKGARGIYYPKYCWKVAISLTTGKPIWVLWFENLQKDSDKFFKQITIEELKNKLGWTVPFKF
jgi:endonuclease G